MAILKKQTFSSVVTLLALVLSVVGAITYFINISAVGYFENAAVPNAVTLMLLSAVALAVVVVVAQLKMSGTAEKLVDVVSGALRIAAPAGLVGAAMLLVEARAQGLAYIYFSNQEVLAEVQTAANLSSATCAIVSIALLAVAAVMAVVAAFGRMKKN